MSQFFNERSGLIICGMITVGCLQSLIALEKIQSNPIVMGGGREEGGIEPKLKSEIFSDKRSL